jgi:hypothetical protein
MLTSFLPRLDGRNNLYASWPLALPTMTPIEYANRRAITFLYLYLGLTHPRRVQLIPPDVLDYGRPVLSADLVVKLNRSAGETA